MEEMLVARRVSPVTEAVTMGPQLEGADHDGHDSAVLARSMIWALPLAAALFSAVWLGIDAVRRRGKRSAAGLAGTRGGRGLPLVAAAAMASAGVVHLALVPEHANDGLAFGAFFIGAAFAQLGLAAAIVARPEPAVLSWSAALSLVLVAVYVVFRLLPPPGAGGAEAFDAVGLATQFLQLVTAVASVAAGRATDALAGQPAGA